MYGGQYSPIYGYGTRGPDYDTRCATCGNDVSECNPEVHAQELRAGAHDYYERAYQGDRDDDRDYTPDDATCLRCQAVGVAWNIDLGDEGVICTDCERPEDWTAEE